MLEYRINENILNNDTEHISFSKNRGRGLFNNKNYSELLYTDDTLHNTMLCDCENDLSDLMQGSLVKVITTVPFVFKDCVSYTDNTFTRTYTNTFVVDNVNRDNRTFTFLVDKQIRLDIESIYTDIETSEETYTEEVDGEVVEKKVVLTYNYIYFKFKDLHYFDSIDQNGLDSDENFKPIRLYIRYVNEEGQNIIVDTLNYDNVTEEEDMNGLMFTIVSPTELRLEYYEEEWLGDSNLKNLFMALFPHLWGYDSDGQVIIYDFAKISSPLNKIVIERDNFLFTEKVSYDISYDKVRTKFKIPLTSRFENNLLQHDVLKTKFVDKIKEESINIIRDNERSVYHPVILKNNVYQDIFKINFNLHFREHRGDNWTTENESYWNGVIKNGDTLKLMEDEGFFSFDSSHCSNQSDLLTYIGMNNKDVRYQKNRLKKSFLRLLFYDSPKPSTQNLLSYATIFLNSGELFAKYAKHIEDNDYNKLNYINVSTSATENHYEYVSTTPMIGIGVDREYGVRSSDSEEYRLSTRLTVTEKNISKNSSEGFYLYLFKETELGTVPQDIYMKVEFNHAGYGRTIPFMMPYKINADELGIKKFEEIINDWSDDNKGYGVYTYQKYSYIKFKAKYDSSLNKHIYYLDNTVYGDVSDFIDDVSTLNINLYEAKLQIK